MIAAVRRECECEVIDRVRSQNTFAHIGETAQRNEDLQHEHHSGQRVGGCPQPRRGPAKAPSPPAETPRSTKGERKQREVERKRREQQEKKETAIRTARERISE